MATREPRIELIPWSYESADHVERMYLQRVACGWRCEEVREQWVELSRAGKKAIYWAVLREGLQDADEIISRHLTENPKESTPIHDIATTHCRLRRDPSGRPFHPIGHVALDLRPEQNEELELTKKGFAKGEAVVWLAGLFISQALQSGGFGREVMRTIEGIAAAADASPFGVPARWVVLDTITKEIQMSPLARQFYLAHGKPMVTVANQDWYERQGYEVFERATSAYKLDIPNTGESLNIDYLYLRKRLS